MARLSAAQRRSLPSSTFGLPGKRAFPMPDKGHAKLAESIATRQERSGRLSHAEAAQIRAKAKRVLKRAFAR